MGDLYISIVPKIKEYPANKEKAAEIVSWLVSRVIIQPGLSDCILSKDHGYPIGEGAVNVVNEPEYLPYSLMTNGLEVITETTTFDAGQFTDEEDENLQLPESDLGFTFWNWPEFKDEFIEDFKKQLGFDVEVIVGKI